MSERHHERAEPERADQYDSPGSDGYQETSAEVRARIASQDDLPTPEESRAATWGDNPHFPDEADLDEDDGDPGTLATEAGTPGQPDTPDAQAQPVDKQPAQPGNVRVTEDPDMPYTSTADQPKALAADGGVTRHEFAQAMQKIADLAAENADLKAENADLVAKSDERDARIDELAARFDEQDARFNRIEQPPAGTDRQSGEVIAPEHSVVKPGSSLSQDALRAARKDTQQGSDSAESARSRLRRAFSSENLDVLQTLGGAEVAIEALATNATRGAVVGGVLAGAGVLKILISKYEKKEKGKQ